MSGWEDANHYPAHHCGAAVLFEDGEDAVLGGWRLDGQVREVAGERREVANQDVLKELEL